MNSALHGMNIICCDSEDFCNRDLHPRYTPRSNIVEVNESATSTNMLMLVVIFLPSLIAVLLLILKIVNYCHKKPFPDEVNVKSEMSQCKVSNQDDLSDELTSGSGSGLPVLVQRTINKEIEFTHLLGQGRYGTVYLAKFRGENVAAKVFNSLAEASWRRETEIYQSVVMRHDNIMGFVASDIDGVGNRLLITHYHESGSLRDLLQEQSLSQRQFVSLAHSLAAGLTHLHTEISGSCGKPGIAHCDLTSKHILIKRDMRCSISDFGLAVKYLSDLDDIQLASNRRVATIRYMAPECLNGTIVADKFDSYKMADMYAVGLLLWEMARRCETFADETSSKCGECEEYLLPYFEYVSREPTFEEMRSVVCADSDHAERNRPMLSPRWENNDLLRFARGLMVDCWRDKPLSRLTSLRVKKSLGKLYGKPDREMAVCFDDVNESV